jgi:hypothetical protein
MLRAPDFRLKEARKKAASKLVQLIIAEDDTMLMLQQVTEQVNTQLRAVQAAQNGGVPQTELTQHHQMLLQLESEYGLLVSFVSDFCPQQGVLLVLTLVAWFEASIHVTSSVL